MKLCIVPRWSGNQDSDCYPWLRARPEIRARYDEVLGPMIDDPGTPTIEAWLDSLGRALADEDLSQVHLMGHSVGCQAVLRYLATLPAGAAGPAGVLCVAGWWDVDNAWGSLRPWVDTPFDMARARAASGKIIVLLSDDDPFTSDHETNARLWRERVGAEVRLVPGAKHFNGAEEPVVLEALLALPRP